MSRHTAESESKYNTDIDEIYRFDDRYYGNRDMTMEEDKDDDASGIDDEEDEEEIALVTRLQERMIIKDKESWKPRKLVAELEKDKRIVVFDDEPDVVNAVSSMLVSIGICIDEDDYDCILTDMDMCGITGFDVLASAGGVPVVLMSGRGDITEEIAIKEGFAAFIPKPVTIDKLKAVFTGNV